ncbi:TetR family transcriptional regulator [Streptomyces sp. 3MP-14]|uniref:TetR family transcriptional regulator n=1 Tax=Streptomyces mimosae TaxID=2586635 RepID=A0A5N6A6L4_9ACTN|nr:TetR family transcriptional regulator [Streptomyces mimosae]KAB8176588.1 TetR family transcriptional regulator [Streptomyces sp. 3MP-14]
MARVSQEYLAARRQQILDGAARCFARDGFHGTSMQDVLRETGLSAGAVYRYFPSKEAMIGALAEDVLGAVREGFQAPAESEHPPPPDELLMRGVRRVGERLNFPASLVLQVWSETRRNPELRAIFNDGFNALLALWTRIVVAYQRDGRMRADIAPEAAARVLAANAQGFLLQRALFGGVDASVLGEGMRALLSFDETAGASRRTDDDEPHAGADGATGPGGGGADGAAGPGSDGG